MTIIHSFQLAQFDQVLELGVGHVALVVGVCHDAVQMLDHLELLVWIHHLVEVLAHPVEVCALVAVEADVYKPVQIEVSPLLVYVLAVAAVWAGDVEPIDIVYDLSLVDVGELFAEYLLNQSFYVFLIHIT